MQREQDESELSYLRRVVSILERGRKRLPLTNYLALWEEQRREKQHRWSKAQRDRWEAQGRCRSLGHKLTDGPGCKQCRERQSKQRYGEFWQAHRALLELERETQRRKGRPNG